MAHGFFPCHYIHAHKSVGVHIHKSRQKKVAIDIDGILSRLRGKGFTCF
jgi:hypothetical protein